jgi:hypothetical protein
MAQVVDHGIAQLIADRTAAAGLVVEHLRTARSNLPTHQIAPDIDNERDYVVASLQAAQTVAKAVTIQLVPPELGHNFAGDPFFTYGKAVLLWLH